MLRPPQFLRAPTAGPLCLVPMLSNQAAFHHPPCIMRCCTPFKALPASLVMVFQFHQHHHLALQAPVPMWLPLLRLRRPRLLTHHYRWAARHHLKCELQLLSATLEIRVSNLREHTVRGHSIPYMFFACQSCTRILSMLQGNSLNNSQPWHQEPDPDTVPAPALIGTLAPAPAPPEGVAIPHLTEEKAWIEEHINSFVQVQSFHVAQPSLCYAHIRHAGG